MPSALGGLDPAGLAQVLALNPVRGAQQVLEEVFVALARGPEQVGAPDEHVARPVGRIVRIHARHLQLAALELVERIGPGVLTLGGGGLGHLQRIGLQGRGRGQPAHALGLGVEVDHRAVPHAVRRGGGEDLVHGHGLVAPLVAVGVEERGGVLLTGRLGPVGGEGQRGPAGLRAQLFLADIVRPATAGLTDATAHHQHVDGGAVVHVHVVPVVHRRADDDHRLAVGLLGVAGEAAGHGQDLVARHRGDGFGPGRRIGLDVVIVGRHVVAAKALVDAVIGQEQVVDAGHQGLALGQHHPLDRHVAHQNIGVVGHGEAVGGRAAEIGEAHADDVVLHALEPQTQGGLATAAVLFLQVPLAVLAPPEADRAVGDHHLAGGVVQRDGLPVGVVGLAQGLVELGGAQQPLGHIGAVLRDQAHQHRQVGIFAQIVAEIGDLAVDVELLEDHVAKGHAQGRVGALLDRQPQVGELGGFRIVGADHHRLGAAIARLGVEVGVGRAGLRDVGAPQDHEAGIEPVGAFGDVGLFPPGLGRGRRQVAIPVVERAADPADQLQIAGSGGVGDHRHGRDRREAEHPVGAVGLDGVGVGGGDDLGDLVPGGADKAAAAAPRHIVGALGRVVLDRGPGGHRAAGHPRRPPQLK